MDISEGYCSIFNYFLLDLTLDYKLFEVSLAYFADSYNSFINSSNICMKIYYKLNFFFKRLKLVHK